MLEFHKAAIEAYTADEAAAIEFFRVSLSSGLAAERPADGGKTVARGRTILAEAAVLTSQSADELTERRASDDLRRRRRQAPMQSWRKLVASCVAAMFVR